MSSRSLIVVALVATWLATANSDAAYYRRGRGRGGYGYGNPFAAALTAMGQLNQLNSQAAMNYQRAYSMALDNRLKYEQTYFQMRKENIQGRRELDALLGHNQPTPEEIIEFNKARTPARLSPSEWDPNHGVFAWPASLAGAAFANERGLIEGLFAARDAQPQAAGLGSENYRQIKQEITTMRDLLRSQIKDVSADEYILGNKFLKSLEYEARFPAGTAG